MKVFPKTQLILILIMIQGSNSSPDSSSDPDLKVSKGQLTFDSEGHEGGIFHTRRAHHPSKESGVTIGRGYDLREKTEAEVRSDFTKAGIDEITTNAYVDCIGLIGEDADE